MGLAAGVPVLYRGIAAGHVTHIGFDPHNPNVIVIRVVIRKDTPLVPGTRARLATSLFSSTAMISLTPPAHAIEGSYHLPHPYPHTLRMAPSRMSTLLTSGAASARSLAVVTRRLERLLSPANLEGIRKALRGLNQSLGLVRRIEGHLDQTARALPRTQHALNQLLGSTRTLVQKSAGVPPAIRRTLGDTRALERILATDTLPQLNRTLRTLSEAASNLSALSHTLARNPQAWLLGRPGAPPGPHPHERARIPRA
ncbi:Mammalian cell entry related domain protein [mine drainage metagenome]|uniref:Mammalian cell entry related domain protein n=1 Tax=mine drainage metagenome TaxID=410659 RepID=T1B0I1_9ZZZZ